jgi:release factor glutamine methyltransferase
MADELGPPWTVLKLLNWTKGFFAEKGVESPRFEAELLLANAIGVDRVQLYMRFDQPLVADELASFRAAVKRRAQGEPSAYITGSRGFYMIDVKCDRRALIPRSDTEVLVEVVLERLGDGPKTVVDIGTGTGVVGLALAHERDDLTLHLTDASAEALALASENVDALGLNARATLHEGDLLAALPDDLAVDAIVSNPPYVSERTRDKVEASVLDWEPHSALFAGEDGLDVIRRLVPQAFERLPSGGLLAFEIGFDQGESAPALVREAGFVDVQMRRDYGDQPRVVSGIKP